MAVGEDRAERSLSMRRTRAPQRIGSRRLADRADQTFENLTHFRNDRLAVPRMRSVQRLCGQRKI
jgi:hypothetical protein